MRAASRGDKTLRIPAEDTMPKPSNGARETSTAPAEQSVLDLLEKCSTGELPAQTVKARLARAGAKELRSGLRQLGLRGRGFPEDAEIAAGALVALKTGGRLADR